ncbi:MAG: thioredoxin family protein [Rhodospirillaceae bacterium]|nr:thioredoxin family protein [Rhodospirillaceae bacterium]
MMDSYVDKEPRRDDIDALRGAALLEFGNAWCGYCRRAEPLIEGALQTHPAVRHFRVADGSGRPLGRSFRVKRWPTLIFLRDGQEVARLVRPERQDEIEQALSAIDAPAP